MTTTTRFAPSPTGPLHLGHVHAALFAQDAAKGGRFLLRIEDLDPVRCRPDFTDAIFGDLAWLGLDWETPVRRQSAHLDEYRARLDQVRGLGLLYPCFCTRADIARAGHAPQGPDGPLYPGTCRGLDPALAAARIAAGAAHAWRLDMAAALARVAQDLGWRDLDRGWQIADPAAFGDVVLGRKDVPASYHLAVTHDDALQGVTLVTRGEDLRAATDLHRLLQALFDLPVPEYRFHGLLTGADGKRLAKRDGAAGIATLRAAGLTAAQVRALAGWPYTNPPPPGESGT